VVQLNSFFLSFNWGINWYHPNRERYKHFIQTFRFLNVFPIKTYQNWNWSVTSHRSSFSLIKPLWGNYICKMLFYKILLSILTLTQRRPFLRKHCYMKNLWFDFNKSDMLKNVLAHKLSVMICSAILAAYCSTTRTERFYDYFIPPTTVRRTLVFMQSARYFARLQPHLDLLDSSFVKTTNTNFS
jgi:hypothetical protein